MTATLAPFRFVVTYACGCKVRLSELVPVGPEPVPCFEMAEAYCPTHPEARSVHMEIPPQAEVDHRG